VKPCRKSCAMAHGAEIFHGKDRRADRDMAPTVDLGVVVRAIDPKLIVQDFFEIPKSAAFIPQIVWRLPCGPLQRFR